MTTAKPTTARLQARSDEILAELADARETIDAADKARDKRLALWLEARRDTKLTFRQLAEAAGVAEPYVIKQVKQNS